MKKKTEKRLMEALAVMGFLFQAAQLGIKIWEVVQRQKDRETGKKIVKT